ncbi:MAG: hypothetical protein M3072_13825 [Candidatus Dormibacteraeota bacterium]|nr:hypothetical protein [Candidatus Dormibacteraeota bacterium]
MSFRYYVILDSQEPDRPRGLFTFNEGDGRYDFVGWDHLDKRWEDTPSLVDYVYGERSDLAAEISRARAEETAAQLGVPLPSQDELVEIANERERERQRGRVSGN